MLAVIKKYEVKHDCKMQTMKYAAHHLLSKNMLVISLKIAITGEKKKEI
jgi:hypothetical protein